MKTIFITIFQGVEAKNILRTNVLRELMREENLRLVFFVRTHERRTYYEREFSNPRIVYEVVNCKDRGALDRFFGRFKFQLIRTATTNLRRRMRLNVTGNYLAYIAGTFLNRIVARRCARRAIRWLDAHVVRNSCFAASFERYQPHGVFLAHLFDDDEIALLREAKRRGVPTIGFVNSWDKLTARCMLRLLPDHLLVYNEIVKREAMNHADMPASRIQITGIPQYDLYVGYHSVSREEFSKRVGIDPGKRFLLYAPMGQTFSSSDWDIIDLLHRWTKDGSTPPDIDILVRFQPNDFLDESELAKRPWLRYDRPGTRFTKERGVDWDMSESEIRHLADTLTHASLLVCYASSMSVDAAVCGKPVINICFEVRPAEQMVKSPTHFYQMEHYQNALATGGIRLVHSEEELHDWICRYCDHPELDAEGRARLILEQCGNLDGRAGERIAGVIREELQRV